MRNKVGRALFWVNIPLYYSVIAPAFFEQPHLAGPWADYVKWLGGFLISYGLLLIALMIPHKIKAGGPGYDPSVLVTSGVFGWVRHPQVAGFISLAFGFACWKLATYHLIICVPYTLLFCLYVWVEEKYLLIPLFGESYLEYRKTTRAVIPFVL